MRTVSTAQEDALRAQAYKTHLRVEVENSTGLYKDLTSLSGTNFVEGARWNWDQDRPVPELTVRLRRDLTTESLAPLMEASTLNVTEAGSTAALLDAGRGVRVYTGVTEAGAAAPTSSELQFVFNGEIDDVAWEETPIQVVARQSIMSQLADRWIEEETPYGSQAGTDIETVLQQILDEWTDTGATLWVPTSPGFLVTRYEQQKETVLRAMTTLVQLIGWDLREVYDAGSDRWRLKFFEPARSASSSQADWTFGSSEYFNVRRLSISRADVRNVISVLYTSTSDGQRKEVTVQSTSSIDRWGRRWMQIEEGNESSIATSSEASTLANAALSDLKDPNAEHSIETSYFWPAELQDFYGFLANGVHYDSDQYLAVYGISHDLTSKQSRTTIKVRGKPAGQYLQWQALGNRHRRDDVERTDDLRLLNFRRVQSSTAQQVTFKWDWAGRTQEAWIHDEIVAAPEVSDIYDQFQNEPPDTVLSRDTDNPEYTVSFPDSGNIRAIQLEPRDENGFPGAIVRVTVQPVSITGAEDLPDESIIASKLVKGAQTYGHDLEWSRPDFDTVAWSTGTVTFLDGEQFDIDAGNTGDMSTDGSLYFVYFDEAVSTSALQATTSSTGLAGDGRVLFAVAKAAAATDQSPFFVPGVGVLGLNEEQLSANIVASNILRANSVTAVEIDVVDLAAINADLGNITAGFLTGQASTNNYLDLDSTGGASAFLKVGSFLIDNDASVWFPSGGFALGGVVGVAGTTDAGAVTKSNQTSTAGGGGLRGVALQSRVSSGRALLDVAGYVSGDEEGGMLMKLTADSSEDWKAGPGTTDSVTEAAAIAVQIGNSTTTVYLRAYASK